MQKNVLHLVASLDPEKGGVSSAVRMLIHGLEKKNIQSETVCFDNPEIPSSKNDRFKIHALNQGKSPWQFNEKLKPWLLNNLSRFDVVILHGLWLYNSYAITRSLEILKKNKNEVKSVLPRLYVMPHGMLDPYFQKSSKRKIKAIRNWVFWKLIENKTIKKADGLLFTCEEEMLLARKTFRPYLPKKELVIGLGLGKPPAYIPEMETNFNAKCPEIKGPYLLFLGRIHEKKGIDLLLHAFNTQYGKQSSPPKLVIAGPDSESEYGAKIKKIIGGNIFLSKNVHLPGMLEGNAKWGSIYGSEAFVLTSHQENFGISIVEALACGIPVLISNKINIWREIKESNSGLVTENSIPGANELLREWQQLDASSRKTMRDQAVKCYENNFSIDKTTENLIVNIFNKSDD